MKPSHQKKDGGVYWLFPVDKPTTIASDTTVHNQPSSSLVSPPSKAQDSAKAEEQEVDQLLDGNDDQPEIVSTLEKEHGSFTILLLRPQILTWIRYPFLSSLDVLLNSNESHVATLDTSRSGKRARESDVEDDDHHSFGSSSRSSTPKRRRLTRSTSPSTSIAPDSPRSMAPSPSPRLGESPRRSNIHKLLHPSSAPHSKHSVTSSVDTPVSPIKSKNPTIYPAVPVPNSALKSTIPENVPTSQAQPLPVLPPTPKTPDDLKVQKASTASTTLPSAPMDVTKSGSSKKRRATKRPREEDSEELEAAQSSPRYITRSHTEGRSGAKRTKVYKC